MKNTLVIGSAGQIGSELIKGLRKQYGDSHVMVGYITGAEPTGELKESEPSAVADIMNTKLIAKVVRDYQIDTIYSLAALLSVVAESKPRLAWKIGIDGLRNILEVAHENHCAVFAPSSIGSFGPTTPRDMTPQDTIRRPQTVYGVSEMTTKLLSDYYFHKYGVGTRTVRFPGVISYVTSPGGGTADYAIDIYYNAVRGDRFVCPIRAGTKMDMIYMPDTLKAAIMLMEASPDKLIHRNTFNIASMSFDPEEIYAAIKEQKPEFEVVYDVDPLEQSIAGSWPDGMDDSCARAEWGQNPTYDLGSMTKNMLEELATKPNK